MSKGRRCKWPGRLLLSFIFVLSLNGTCRAHPGWGIVVDKRGSVYFADVFENKIHKISPEGRLVTLATGLHSHVLWLDASDNVYGEHVYYVEQGNQWIRWEWRLAPDGRLLRTPWPEGLALVADSQGNHYRSEGACIRRIAPDGSTTIAGGDPLAGAPRGEHPRIQGLALDPRGNLYVADQDYRCLRQITPEGGVNTIYASGPFWSPSGVTIAGGDIYLLENRPESLLLVLQFFSGPRVRRLSPKGTAVTLVTVHHPKVWVIAAAVVAAITAGALALAAWRRRGRMPA